MSGDRIFNEPLENNTLLTIGENLAGSMDTLNAEMVILGKKAKKSFTKAKNAYEPWKTNIFFDNLIDEQEWSDSQNVKPEEVLKNVITRSRDSVGFVRRLEDKGFDLSSPDYRGKLSNLVRFVDGGFWEDALGNAGGMFRGETTQRDASYTDNRQAMLNELLYLFTTGSWRRGKDISISDHEVLHSQQFNREGNAEPNEKMKRVHSIPLLLCLGLIDKWLPKLGIGDKVLPAGSPVHEAHAFLGSTEDFLIRAVGDRATVQRTPRIIIDNLRQTYEFNPDESAAAVWAMLRLRAVTNYIHEFVPGRPDQNRPNFDQDIGALIYDWELKGKSYDKATHTFPDMESKLKEYQIMAGFPEHVDNSSHEVKQVMAKLVQWDMLNRRADGLRFSIIAHDEIANSLNLALQDRAIKTAYLPNVVAEIDGVKKKALNYWRLNDDYPAVFFPADKEHPYTIDRMTGYAFGPGKYQGGTVIEATDEKMECYRVDLTNKLDEQEPRIKSLSKVNENHLKVVLPKFVEMVAKAREHEKRGEFPHWGSETQSLLTAALGSRFDGMPWQYRFTAVVYGLGLEDKANELMDYMKSRIQAGELSRKEYDEFGRARYTSRSEVEKVQTKRSEKPVNQMPPALRELVQSRIQELPDAVFRRLSIYDMHDREGDDMVFYLGPDISKAIKDKVSQIHQDSQKKEKVESVVRDEDTPQIVRVLETLQEHLPEQASSILEGILSGAFDIWWSMSYIRDYFSSKTK